MTVGAVFAVLGVGVLIGFIGRLAMPGRHGLVLVVTRDLKLLPRILLGAVPGRIGVFKTVGKDIPLRWCLGIGVAGAFAGYATARAYSTLESASLAALVGAVAFLVLAAFLFMVQRTAPSRRLGLDG